MTEYVAFVVVFLVGVALGKYVYGKVRARTLTRMYLMDSRKDE